MTKEEIKAVFDNPLISNDVFKIQKHSGYVILYKNEMDIVKVDYTFLNIPLKDGEIIERPASMEDYIGKFVAFKDASTGNEWVYGIYGGVKYLEDSGMYVSQVSITPGIKCSYYECRPLTDEERKMLQEAL